MLIFCAFETERKSWSSVRLFLRPIHSNGPYLKARKNRPLMKVFIRCNGSTFLVDLPRSKSTGITLYLHLTVTLCLTVYF